MLVLISLTCVLQVMLSSCQATESNLTSNSCINVQNHTSICFVNKNATNDLAKNISVNESNDKVNNTSPDSCSICNDTSPDSCSTCNSTSPDSCSTCNSTSDTSNDTLSSFHDMTVNGSMEVADSSVSEEIVMTGTPVMCGCINGTADASTCMARLLNLTLECANVTGASQDDVDIAMRMEIPSSDAGKCLTRCLLKQRGVMTPEGAFSPSATVDYLTEIHRNDSLQMEFQKLADYCTGKLKLQPMSSLDTCQFAYDIALCTEEYHKTLFLRNPAMAPPVNAITTP